MSTEAQDPPSGPACFLDHYRICGPDCAAYDLQGESAGKVHAPSHCSWLIGVKQLVRSVRQIEISLSTKGGG